MSNASPASSSRRCSFATRLLARPTAALLALVIAAPWALAQTQPGARAGTIPPPAVGRPAPGVPQPGDPADGIVGVWLDDTGQGAVEIQRCGIQLCGRIVWLKSPADRSGRPLTDGYNPDARKRSRPICGLDVIGGLKPHRGGAWDEGWIYDPKDGKSYDVALRLAGPDRLEVTGYLGVKWLSETFTWTRAPGNLALCRI
jgi:uncharacterized protein (DUF2147 family)